VSKIERALSKVSGPADRPSPTLDGPSDEIGVGPLVEFGPSNTDERLIAVHDPTGAASEHFRRLKVKLRLMSKRTRSVLLTSAVEDEGKSTTWLNLAIVMARDPDCRVVAVDADLRQSALGKFVNMPDEPGLTDVLRGRKSLADTIRPTSIDGLSLLPAGSEVQDPVELLSMPAMTDTLKKLVAHYDFVLLDGPPVLAVTDSTVIGALVNGVVVVIRAFRTKRRAVERALSLLDKSPVIGFVLNGMEHTHGEYYYKYYKKRKRRQD